LDSLQPVVTAPEPERRTRQRRGAPASVGSCPTLMLPRRSAVFTHGVIAGAFPLGPE
jgi:hypothetical protein